MKSVNEFVSKVSRRLADEIGLLRSRLGDQECSRLLVAFSGGPDSTALLVALAQCATEAGFDISACHINHGLRGAESDLDHEFSQNLCDNLGIPFAACRLHVNNVDRVVEWTFGENFVQDQIRAGKPLSDSLETMRFFAGDYAPENLLRDMRYECLTHAALVRRAHVLLTGHTLDDQAETMLFRLFRGTAPHGLKGIEGHRELIRSDGIWLVRPMLGVTKLDCQRFLAIEEIGAQLDTSNEDAHYARNFIRHRLVPSIEDRFPAWRQHLDQLRRILSDEDEWLDRITERERADVSGCDKHGEYFIVDRFMTKPKALRRRLLVAAMKERDIEPSFERVENVLNLIDTGGTALDLSEQWSLRLLAGKMRWLSQVDRGESPSPYLLSQETEVFLPEQGAVYRSNLIAWLNKSVQISNWQGEGLESSEFPEPDALEALVDLSRVNTPLKLRLRRPGDLIQPFGMTQHVRLKRYLQTHKPKSEDCFGRDGQRMAVVLVDADEVLWVPGVGLSEKLRVVGKPTHRLTLQDLTDSVGPSTWA